MRKAIAFMVLVIGLLAGTAAPGGQPGRDWMPADEVKQKLMDSGYSSVTSVKAEHGGWEGEGIKKGRPRAFHVDPMTGAVMSEKLDD